MTTPFLECYNKENPLYYNGLGKKLAKGSARVKKQAFLLYKKRVVWMESIKGVRAYADGAFAKCDLLLFNNTFSALRRADGPSGAAGTRYIVIPGLIDVHVHLREPGFFYKEGILTGTKAAAKGGVTSVFAMPNVNPVPDSLRNLQIQQKLIEENACVKVYPYAAITAGQQGKLLADMEELAGHAIAFSDDGKGVQSNEIMSLAMEKAKALGKIIVAHCEDEKLVAGGYIHDGGYAKTHGHIGNPSASEYIQVARDLELVERTGCAYHVCHVSTKESVELIRQAKKKGLDVTCETAPHYLAFCDDDLAESGDFKMNPPIRAKEDKEALIAGICDGTIDMIATDHAPHSHEEKSGGLRDSLNGVSGLEISFAAMYTELVMTKIITLEKLIGLMCVNPAKRFKLSFGIEETGDFAVFDLHSEFIVEPEKFLSKGKYTPFRGKKLYGECIFTAVSGRAVWEKE